MGVRTKKKEELSQIWCDIIYYLKVPFMLIYNFIKTKVFKSTVKKLLFINGNQHLMPGAFLKKMCKYS